MNVREVKQIAQTWAEAYAARNPGLWGAHLVGSITTQPEEAVYPDYKDVDMHLVFEPGHPALENHGPFMNILETEYQGAILEVGLKPATWYQSVETVVTNPEIAHHLTVNSILYDPHRCLSDLLPAVKKEYPRRKWVQARIDYERKGLEQVDAYFQMVASRMRGEAFKAGLLGYSFTYLTPLLCVATLRPPTSGSRTLLRMREILAEYHRLDLYQEAISILGVSNLTPQQVEQFLQEGAEAFDIAVKIRRTPNPFQHKLNPHQRGYFLESCRALIAEHHSAEAVFWLLPFYFATIEVILADGEERDRPRFLQHQRQFLKALKLDDPETVDANYHRLSILREYLLDLADQIVAAHPGISD